jgi:hypothetical protein
LVVSQIYGSTDAPLEARLLGSLCFSSSVNQGCLASGQKPAAK